MWYIVQQHAAVINNFLGAHALSGCDIVSSFSGIGKATFLKMLMTSTYSLCLSDLSAMLDEVTDSCFRFVATLYGKELGASLNSMRARHRQKNNCQQMSCTTKAEQFTTHYGCLQTPLSICPFPNNIVEGCRQIFTPKFGPITEWVGNECTRTLTSLPLQGT